LNAKFQNFKAQIENGRSQTKTMKGKKGKKGPNDAVSTCTVLLLPLELKFRLQRRERREK
jgi:hypothetical protein